MESFNVEKEVLVGLIESDIRICERLIEDYEIKAKNDLYYFGLLCANKDRVECLKSYLVHLLKL